MNQAERLTGHQAAAPRVWFGSLELGHPQAALSRWPILGDR